MLLTVRDAAKPNALNIAEIIEKTLKDTELSSVKEALNIGRWSEKLKAYYPFKDELCLVGETVMRSDRIIIPLSLRQQVFKLAHIGHPGIERTKQRLKSKVWWPNIDKDAERSVKTCLDCQLVSNITRPDPMISRELPSQPWNTLAMDILGPLPCGESILVMIDLYSRFRLTDVLLKTTTEEIIDKLKQNFLRMGIPTILISDNAKNFSSQKMQDARCNQFGIQLKHTTPYWPQANGEVERSQNCGD